MAAAGNSEGGAPLPAHLGESFVEVDAEEYSRREAQREIVERAWREQEEYARGVRVDQSRLQEAMGEIDMSSPEALQELMGSGLLQPEDTEEQRAAVAEHR